MKPITEWFIALIVVISEWIHGKRTERREKRDAEHGEPWSYPLRDGGEPHVHLQ